MSTHDAAACRLPSGESRPCLFNVGNNLRGGRLARGHVEDKATKVGGVQGTNSI